MKTKYPSMFGVLAALLLVASFIIPTNLVSPSPVEAACVWDVVDMPGSIGARGDIAHATEVNKIVVGSDGKTILALRTSGAATVWLWTSPLMGLIWTPTAYFNLTGSAGWTAGDDIYDVAIAPDDNAFWVVVTGAAGTGPLEVWITENAGGKWENTGLAANLAAGDFIGAMDVSIDYGGQRDIAVGIRRGNGSGTVDIYALQTAGFAGWAAQTAVSPVDGDGDVFALKFSPSYAADSALAVVYADNSTGVQYNVALRDIDLNDVNQWAFATSVIVQGAGVSPPFAFELADANLELPSDFNGAAASLRRAYISTDSDTANKDDGIFRIDNTTVYVLMDTSADTDTRRISSIAYFGTYASGKLLAGEYIGYACTATVPTWFTDSPTTCPVPCWYPCLKCPTGAAGPTVTCNLNGTGVGNAQVVWFMGGTVALAATGSSVSDNGATWWQGVLAAPVEDDESAISLSRNNGETWNQIAFIDTTIDFFNDFVFSADCNTLYLASASVNNTVPCAGFDSVWRSSLNAAVISPLPPMMPIGTWYERVYTRPTELSCNTTHSDLPLLRLPPGCDEPTGQIVAWAAQTTQAQAWSPDYGDYWANITARFAIEDFAFESSTIIYNLSNGGLVQKLPYTGTSWATTQPSVNTGVSTAHMITAMPTGNVMVGYDAGATYAVAVSKNGGASFAPIAQPLAGVGNVHVAFDPDYANNNMVYIADDGATGSVYRNSVASPIRWIYLNMMGADAIGCPAPAANAGNFYGLVLAYTGAYGQTALYAADNTTTNADIPTVAGVWRTLTPLSGLPKPGIAWDRLDLGLAATTRFTLEPYSLKLCGCCTLDTDTNLYALDDNAYDRSTMGVGWLWAYNDCFAKKGPALVTEDKALIGCDPVSGRAQEVNLCWEQLCLGSHYDIEISKNTGFNILVIDWISEAVCGGLRPVAVTSPCVYFPAGGLATTVGGGTADGGTASAIAAWGNLECGHTYYWRVKVRQCVYGENIRSPWSDVRSFTVKAGLPVSSPYLGVQLLSPNNGCLACVVSPASFSWSPLKETTKYHFVLSKNADLTSPIAEADTTGTAFEYDGTLEYSTNYFWQVKALEPAPSDPSATFSFMTEAAPAAEAGAAKAAPTPVWVWVIIAIGAILVIVTLVLIFKTRRV